MRKYIILVLAVLTQLTHEYSWDFDYGSKIVVNCSLDYNPIQFKVLREFGLALQSSNLVDKQVVTFTIDKVQQCKMDSNVTICAFNGMIRQMNVLCPAPMMIELLVVKPEILAERATAHGRYVEVAEDDF